ncbi:MAG: tyrosine-type recombinase/integrase [Clostridia bacterium]|nr:tyrosine-type recombinase/integrase [Clostridia bacterium]
MQCVIDKIIAYADNPMLRVFTPVSFQKKEPVQAFEIEEQRKLIKYLLTKPLVKSSRCNYDERTLRNLFICSLLSAARIGELGAIDITKNIDLKANGFIINRTLSSDDGKIVMGATTKTGRKKVEQGLLDERFVPFDIFDEELMLKVVKDQIKNAKSNFNNKENLLFCQLDGSYIDHRCINNIFKRICREAGVKLDLTKGCHTHMCRHTAVTRMIEAGMDLLVIAAILGHVDDRQIKETYGHILARYRNRQLKDCRAYSKKVKLCA